MSIYERPLSLRRFEGAQRESRVRSTFGTLRAELNTVHISHAGRSQLLTASHVLLATIDGGAKGVSVQIDRADSWCGPKQSGAAGFFPAGRLVTSIWPKTTLTYAALFIDPGSAEEMLGRGDSPAEWRPCVCADDPFLAALMQRLAFAMRRAADTLASCYAESLATVIYLYAAERFSRIDITTGAEREAIARAVRLIGDAFPQAVPLSALAAESRLPRGRFLQQFREQMGCSPHQYIIRERLRHARTLMQTTNRTLEDIAHSVGCASAGHLAALFRRHIGVSPRAWRSDVNRM